MASEDLSKEADLKISIGHLLVVWDVLSNKISGLPLNESFTEEEKRAIWALEDLCEQELIRSGVTRRPAQAWEELVEAAREYVKTIPVDALD